MSEELDKLFGAMGQPDYRERKGKRGGWRGKPGSLQALKANWTGHASRRKCARPNCGQIAVRGSSACRMHGGGAVLAREGRLSKARIVNRRLGDAERVGGIPGELAAHPAYIAARAQYWRGSLLASEMLAAFLSREENPAAWVAVLNKAKEAGLINA